MFRQAATQICLPILLIGMVAAPVGLVAGSYHWLCAAVSIALTVPAGLVTLVGAMWLSRHSPFGKIYAVFLGTFLRMAVGFLGGLVVFVASGPTFRTGPVIYWLWFLVSYLISMITEVVLLLRRSSTG